MDAAAGPRTKCCGFCNRRFVIPAGRRMANDHPESTTLCCRVAICTACFVGKTQKNATECAMCHTTTEDLDSRMFYYIEWCDIMHELRVQTYIRRHREPTTFVREGRILIETPYAKENPAEQEPAALAINMPRGAGMI
jgi:hypothetical protein